MLLEAGSGSVFLQGGVSYQCVAYSGESYCRGVHNFGNPFFVPSHSLFVVHGEKSLAWSCSCLLQVQKLSKLLTMHTAVSLATFFLFLSFVHTPIDSKIQSLPYWCSNFTSMLLFFFFFFHVLAFSSKMCLLCKWQGRHLWQGGWCTVCKKALMFDVISPLMCHIVWSTRTEDEINL